jgi:hypothetical protein
MATFLCRGKPKRPHPSSLQCLSNRVTCSCLRNVVALFHVLQKEQEYRKSAGKTGGYEALKSFKPILAVGAEHPLEDDLLMADYFREY